MNVLIRGQTKPVTLTQKEFVASGGEAKIYGKNGTIYKIFHDKARMVPTAKIQELHNLKDLSNIIIPEDLILNPQKPTQILGFTMKEAQGMPICRYFATTFQRREGVTVTEINEIVEQIVSTTKTIHKRKFLIVDGNHVNYLVTLKPKEFVSFIDTTSWQTPSFPPTALMPNIRDYLTKGFSELTDWFSFAIIACQLYIGIHPYQGGHPKYKQGDFQSRMKDNVSIFNKDVALPPVVRDFSTVPTNYLEWFKDLFEKGARKPPPSIFGKIIPVAMQVQIIASNEDFSVIQLQKFDNDLLFHVNNFGFEVSKTATHIHIGGIGKFQATLDTEVVFTPKMAVPVFVKCEKDTVKFFSPNQNVQQLDIKCDDHMIVENTLYLVQNGKLMQVAFFELPNKIIPSIPATKVWEIMPKSHIVFGGVIFQNIMGSAYLTIPLPKTGGCVHARISELDGKKILDAKHSKGVCQIIVDNKDGSTEKLVIRFSDAYDVYDILVKETVQDRTLNFVVLDNGIVISMEEDHMKIFKKSLTSNTIKTIKNKYTNNLLTLCDGSTKLLGFTQNVLYRLAMKK